MPWLKLHRSGPCALVHRQGLSLLPSSSIIQTIPTIPFINANVRFAERELTWRIYTAAEALPTTGRVEIIDKEEFAATTLNEDEETFVVDVAAIMGSKRRAIHPSREAQIASLSVEEAPVVVPSEYSDFADIVLKDASRSYPNTPVSTIMPSTWKRVSSHPMDPFTA